MRTHATTTTNRRPSPRMSPKAPSPRRNLVAARGIMFSFRRGPGAVALPGPQHRGSPRRAVLPPHSKSSGKVGDVNILAVSVGSSRIKLRVIDDDDTTLATKDHRDPGPGVSQVACFDTSFPTDMPVRA